MESDGSGNLREELLSRSWWIGLDGWVLQDGNYTDFVTGERRQFALEFGYSRTKRLEFSSNHSEPRCSYSGRDVKYEVAGQLLRTASEPLQDAFVLDFGLRAYKEWMVLDDPEPPEAGDWLTGEVYLSVDHFAYMDYLAERPGMPPLIYTWTLEEIQLETTPPMRVEYGHPLYVGPDEGPMLVRDHLKRAGAPSPRPGSGMTREATGSGAPSRTQNRQTQWPEQDQDLRTDHSEHRSFHAAMAVHSRHEHAHRRASSSARSAA